ncbi:YjfB family protein [Massilia sp. S19_KUP03_FR1]|uniref:YjfB family protein n=1 Tax=Massilia sp. S19_KUP03_FR1 TaxID=3025503 RepID=UPI002FCCE1D1
MDAMSIARLSTSIAETGTKNEVGLTVLKKAQDIQASTAEQLLGLVTPMPGAQNLPSHLGNTINTTA